MSRTRRSGLEEGVMSADLREVQNMIGCVEFMKYILSCRCGFFYCEFLCNFENIINELGVKYFR